VEIADIEYNDYCFSDGVCIQPLNSGLTSLKVGKISQSLAELVTNAIGYDPVLFPLVQAVLISTA